MRSISGKDLQDYLDTQAFVKFKKRFCYSLLEDYAGADDPRVCCLFGLRRTGKTVLMQQLALELLRAGKRVMYITCENGTSIMDIRRVLDNDRFDCVFIDEVTRCYNFIGSSSILADCYVSAVQRIIMAGTDSLGFLLARSDALFDRARLIHTTYIPYKEYYYLLGLGFDEYLRYGGTLTNGYVFYNDETCAEYMNSAIVDNILHSLEHYDQGRRFDILTDVYESGELPSCINKVIELNNRRFLASTINGKFRSHDLGSLQEFIDGSEDMPDSFDLYNQEELQDRVRIYLGVHEKIPVYVDEDCSSRIIEYLVKLELLYPIRESKEYIFTQPGMRYCQVEAIINALVDDETFHDLSENVKQYLLNKLKSDMHGKLMEDIVYLEIAKVFHDRDKYHIERFRDAEGREIDITVSCYSPMRSIAIEVKYSKVTAKEQVRHLLDEEFCFEVKRKLGGEIIDKMVIYRGDSCVFNTIKYINVEEFLCNMTKYIVFRKDLLCC